MFPYLIYGLSPQFFLFGLVYKKKDYLLYFPFRLKDAKVYQKDGQLFCESDYKRKFVPRCGFCSGFILDVSMHHSLWQASAILLIVYRQLKFSGFLVVGLRPSPGPELASWALCMSSVHLSIQGRRGTNDFISVCMVESLHMLFNEIVMTPFFFKACSWALFPYGPGVNLFLPIWGYSLPLAAQIKVG